MILQQYSCLYGFTDKTFNLYEDDIPGEMVTQIGQRVTFVNEMIIYSALKACTNAYYGGTGTTVATVSSGLTLGLIRKIVQNLQANHAKPVTSVLKAGPNYGTDAAPAELPRVLPHRPRAGHPRSAGLHPCGEVRHWYADGKRDRQMQALPLYHFA